jgi:hypothetical protein
MPSSSVRTFADPDDYGETVRSTTAKVTVIERGRFNAKTVSIHLHRLWIHRISDNLPRIAHVVNMAAQANFLFRTEVGSELFHNGLEIDIGKDAIDLDHLITPEQRLNLAMARQ